MTALILSALLLSPHIDPPPLDVSYGYFSHYAEAPTLATIAYRQEAGQIPHDLSGYDGVIAVPDCDRIGDRVTLYIGGRSYQAMIFDCSGHIETTRWMRANGILGELGHGLAQQIGIVGQGGIAGGMVTYDQN